MKDLRLVWCVLLVAAIFLGCNHQKNSYTVTKNGTEFYVDIEQKTISAGGHIYRYTFTGDASDYRIEIQYPDGSSFWDTKSQGGGAGGWSDDYDADAYTRGEILVDILLEGSLKQTDVVPIFVSMLLIIVGIADLVFPRISWYLGYGWRYKDAEPSDAALAFARIGGFAVIVVGVGLLFS